MLQEVNQKNIMKLEDENAHLKSELKSAMDNLCRQQETVVKPLLKECMKLKSENAELHRDIKAR